MKKQVELFIPFNHLSCYIELSILERLDLFTHTQFYRVNEQTGTVVTMSCAKWAMVLNNHGKTLTKQMKNSGGLEEYLSTYKELELSTKIT